MCLHDTHVQKINGESVNLMNPFTAICLSVCLSVYLPSIVPFYFSFCLKSDSMCELHCCQTIWLNSDNVHNMAKRCSHTFVYLYNTVQHTVIFLVNNMHPTSTTTSNTIHLWASRPKMDQSVTFYSHLVPTFDVNAGKGLWSKVESKGETHLTFMQEN